MKYEPQVGREDTIHGRTFYTLRLPDTGSWPETISLRSPRFVLLLAMDSTEKSADEVGRIAEAALSAGAVYVCTWGPDAIRVEEIFDEVCVGPDGQRTYPLEIITTSHEETSLREAVRFFLDSARPASALQDGCESWLAVCVGNDDWAKQISLYLLD